MTVELADIHAARERIRPHVRRTPLLPAAPFRDGSHLPPGLLLKLESLQVTGSFKARGAVNKILGLDPEVARRGIVTASGGNHGLGVAYAAGLARAPVVIYLPTNASPSKAEKLRSWGAEVVVEGPLWDDADVAARAAARERGWTYVHAFADPAIVAGQGTVGLEILEDAPDVGTLLVAIGGGGLISGVASAAKLLRPGIRIVGVEPEGAALLYESLRAGRLVELTKVETAANTLASRTSAPLNFEIIRRTVDEIVLVSDDEMREAARWLWQETGIAVELSGAASLAALLAGRLRPAGDNGAVCALICGAGTDGI